MIIFNVQNFHRAPKFNGPSGTEQGGATNVQWAAQCGSKLGSGNTFCVYALAILIKINMRLLGVCYFDIHRYFFSGLHILSMICLLVVL